MKMEFEDVKSEQCPPKSQNDEIETLWRDFDDFSQNLKSKTVEIIRKNEDLQRGQKLFADSISKLLLSKKFESS